MKFQEQVRQIKLAEKNSGEKFWKIKKQIKENYNV